MKLQLNGTPVLTEATTLAQLLDETDYGTATIATAVNGAFVPAALRTDHALTEGDQIEVLAPMQGG